MVIFLQEDHELPLIDGTARIRGGSHNEPAAKSGWSIFSAKSGAPAEQKLKPAINSMIFWKCAPPKLKPAAVPIQPPSACRCLKGDFDDVFKVFADLLRNPEFRADKLDIAQKQADDSISRRNDEIGGIAARESAKLAYGADNPYAREPEYSTVAAVTRQDLIDWHKTYVHPNHIILGISGDFDAAAMEAKLRAAFDSWPKGPELPKDESSISSREARLLPDSERRREPEQHPHGRRSAPRATIPITTRSLSSTRPSAEDFLRGCSMTFAPSAA